eukprot:scaffold26732_cov33-Tisochrysis_lutea.AAC.2
MDTPISPKRQRADDPPPALTRIWTRLEARTLPVQIASKKRRNAAIATKRTGSNRAQNRHPPTQCSRFCSRPVVHGARRDPPDSGGGGPGRPCR